MGVLDNVRRRMLIVLVKQLGIGRAGSLLSNIFTGYGSQGVAPEKSYQKLIEGYKSWVYSCVTKIAQTIAGGEWKLYAWKGDEKVYIDKHPFLDLIKRPNQTTTRWEFIFDFMVRLELAGKSFWYAPKNSVGRPGELWLLPMSKYGEVKPIPSKEKFIAGYRYQESEKIRDFTPEEIIWFKYLNPGDPFDGYSPLHAQDYPYDIDLFLSQQQYSLFERGAQPGATFVTDERLEPGAVRELKEEFDHEFGGASRAGGTLFLHSGFKPHKLQLSASEFNLGEVAEWVRDKITSAYDVSAGKLGLVKDVNRANAEVLHHAFIMECIRPKAQMIKEKLEAEVLSLYDDEVFLEIPFTAVKDRQLDIKEREAMFRSASLTPNEWREATGLDPVPWGNTAYVPVNFVPVGSLDDEGKSVKEPPALPESPVTLAKALPEKDKEALWKELFWKAFVQKAENWERVWIPTLRRLFRGQRKEVIRKLNAGGGKLIETFTNMPDNEVLKLIKKRPATIAEVMFDWDKWIEKFRKAGAPINFSVFKDKGEEAIARLNASVSFDLSDPRAVEFLGKKTAKFSLDVNTTTAKNLTATLREGFAEGESTTALATRVNKVYAQAHVVRAPRIARTETIASSNAGALEGMKQSLVVAKKMWLTAGDENTRESHADAGSVYGSEKNAIPLEGYFTLSTGAMMQFPGDSWGQGVSAGDVVNCILPDNEVRGSFVGGIRSKYVGSAREIITKSGQRLSLTPNHPVLTSKGFVPTGELSQSDYLVTYRPVARNRINSIGLTFSEINEEQKPATIENVFKALKPHCNSRPCNLRPHDLHGDARWIEGEVDIVLPEGPLLLEGPPPGMQNISDSIFMHEAMRKAFIPSDGSSDFPFQGVFVASSGLPSSGALALDQFRISLEDGPFEPLRFGMSSELDSLFMEMAHEGRTRDGGGPRKLIEREAPLIAFDQIIEIRDFEFCGHVYDLQSTSGLMIAQNIFISNCRCSILEVVGKEP